MMQKTRLFVSVVSLFFLILANLASAAPETSRKTTAPTSTKSSATAAKRPVKSVKKAKGTKKKVRKKVASRRAVPRKQVAQRQLGPSTDPDLRRKLSARSAIVIDAKTGETLYAHSPDLPGQPASTLKVLTGLLAIHSLKGSEMVEVSRKAALMPSSKVFLQAGNNYRANDLINAVLLASANDASVALAEKIAGSEYQFAQMMTSKAHTLGAANTECKNATGLTAVGQKSTARDLATIFRTAMKDRAFSERMAMITCKTSDGKVLRNHNKALWQMDCAEGGKTGYTQAARQTYVGKFSRDDRDVIVALLGSETMWNDIRNLVNHGLAVAGRGHDTRSAAVKPVAKPSTSKKGVAANVLTSQQAGIVSTDDGQV